VRRPPPANAIERIAIDIGNTMVNIVYSIIGMARYWIKSIPTARITRGENNATSSVLNIPRPIDAS